jgi:hypothetical protein
MREVSRAARGEVIVTVAGLRPGAMRVGLDLRGHDRSSVDGGQNSRVQS